MIQVTLDYDQHLCKSRFGMILPAMNLVIRHCDQHLCKSRFWGDFASNEFGHKTLNYDQHLCKSWSFLGDFTSDEFGHKILNYDQHLCESRFQGDFAS